MFDVLSVCYLFLGGCGSGVLLVCACIDLLFLRQTFGTSIQRSTVAQKQGEPFMNAGFIVGESLLLLGIVCLALDLGRQDRILNLLSTPSLSIPTIGAYALVFLALLGFLLVLPRLFYLPSIGTVFVRGVEIISLCLSLVCMLYTGLLLFSMKAVHFWDNPLIPILFVLSSLSSGSAVVLIVGFFSERNEWCSAMLRRIVLADSVVILLETVCVAAFFWIASRAESTAAQESLKNLLSGSEALVWWLGFILCGMLFPLVAELLFLKSDTRSAQTALALAMVLVLVGAFCLRSGLVEVGYIGDVVEGYVNSEEQNTELRLEGMTMYD
ncbi:MAG: polysulfide reductase NrfD [Coriobacteriales bacterium]|jgi:formate-dependent nitrite reductase membrane component NrfD|nr:polysulfide reductase NrfD [Coriobacteriales bacterium]